MNIKEYLKSIFSDKKVKISVLIIALSLIILLLVLQFVENTKVHFLFEIICFVLMFTQFPTISGRANQVYEELEQEEKEQKKDKIQHKKKKK